MNSATTTEPTPTTITAETLAERIARLAPGEDCTERMDILADAADAGVSDKDLALMAKAPRIAEGDEITLPRHKLENLSRGKGWARCGSGRSAEWGKRCADGYRVGPGYWVVGGSDGYARKGEITWDVSHIRAGGKVWTVAV